MPPLKPMRDTLADRLKSERKIKRWTQEDMAIKLDLAHKSRYANWEQGRKQPSPEHIAQLATLFQVSVDYMMGRTDLRVSLEEIEERERALLGVFELTDKEILETYEFTVDGETITPAQARRLIAFVRAERSIEVENQN